MDHEHAGRQQNHASQSDRQSGPPVDPIAACELFQLVQPVLHLLCAPVSLRRQRPHGPIQQSAKRQTVPQFVHLSQVFTLLRSRRTACHQCVKGSGETVQIAGRIETEPPGIPMVQICPCQCDLLRRRIVPGTASDQPLLCAADRNIKVDQADISTCADHNVGRLNVTVDNGRLSGVQILQHLAELFEPYRQLSL